MNYKPKAPMLTPELARKMIDNANIFIGLMQERLSTGYAVEETQQKICKYKQERDMLIAWLKENDND